MGYRVFIDLRVGEACLSSLLPTFETLLSTLEVSSTGTRNTVDGAFTLSGLGGVGVINNLGLASWGKVLTQDQLKRRGWNLANRCFLCCAEEETINHILVHCSKARVLWDLMFSLFGVNWVLLLMVRDTLLAIGGSTGQLLEQNAQAFNQISANLASLQIQDNISLFCQARDNIQAILNEYVANCA
ncbi:hypothetical protein AAG906_009077 [Vitis piasezkii]